MALSRGVGRGEALEDRGLEGACPAHQLVRADDLDGDLGDLLLSPAAAASADGAASVSGRGRSSSGAAREVPGPQHGREHALAVRGEDLVPAILGAGGEGGGGGGGRGGGRHGGAHPLSHLKLVVPFGVVERVREALPLGGLGRRGEGVFGSVALGEDVWRRFLLPLSLSFRLLLSRRRRRCLRFPVLFPSVVLEQGGASRVGVEVGLCGGGREVVAGVVAVGVGSSRRRGSGGGGSGRFLRLLPRLFLRLFVLGQYRGAPRPPGGQLRLLVFVVVPPASPGEGGFELRGGPVLVLERRRRAPRAPGRRRGQSGGRPAPSAASPAVSFPVPESSSSVPLPGARARARALPLLPPAVAEVVVAVSS